MQLFSMSLESCISDSLKYVKILTKRHLINDIEKQPLKSVEQYLCLSQGFSFAKCTLHNLLNKYTDVIFHAFAVNLCFGAKIMSATCCCT